MRTEQRKITEPDDMSTVMNSPLSYEELISALSKLKLKRSPGPDVIHSHPMREKMDAMTKHRIEKQGFIHKNTKLKTTYNNNSIKTVKCTYSIASTSSDHTN